jgi:hypothetical protein
MSNYIKFVDFLSITKIKRFDKRFFKKRENTTDAFFI